MWLIRLRNGASMSTIGRQPSPEGDYFYAVVGGVAGISRLGRDGRDKALLEARLSFETDADIKSKEVLEAFFKMKKVLLPDGYGLTITPQMPPDQLYSYTGPDGLLSPEGFSSPETVFDAVAAEISPKPAL